MKKTFALILISTYNLNIFVKLSSINYYIDLFQNDDFAICFYYSSKVFILRHIYNPNIAIHK